MNVYGKQVVHPWLCDSMGHLSTRHYMAMFDDASYHLLAECSGWTPNASEGEWRGKGWADVRHIVQYQAEVLAGSLIEIHGRVEELGNSSVSYRLEMRELGKEVAAATFEAPLSACVTAPRAEALTAPGLLRKSSSSSWASAASPPFPSACCRRSLLATSASAAS